MPTLATKTFAQLLSEQLAQIGASLGVTPDWTSGSALLAIMQSVTSQEDFLQGAINAVAAITRAQTSTGADLDSFVADFGLVRLAATFNTGKATFGLLAAKTTQVVLPTGTVIQTVGGAIQYTVTADTSNTAYSAGLGGYPIAAGATSVIASVSSVLAGTASGVQPATLTQFASPVPGIDTVTNALAIVNGLDAETDAALRTRFTNTILALARSTGPAFDVAIGGVQSGLRWVRLENTNTVGAQQFGFNTVYVDDGSGAPPSSLLTSVATALNNYRALGVQVAVLGPVVTTISVVCTAAIAAGAVAATIKANVAAAITKYINGLGFAANVLYTKIYQVAYDADPNVVEISALTVNGGVLDITIAGAQLPVAGTVTVN